eukprot:3264415-Pyramimonas_sp.AAC.2
MCAILTRGSLTRYCRTSANLSVNAANNPTASPHVAPGYANRCALLIPVNVQAECEDLSGRVEKLNEENSLLREELQRLKDACTTLTNDKQELEVRKVQRAAPEFSSLL